MEGHEQGVRLPRYRRHRFRKPAFALQARDTEIIRVVSQHRFIASDDLRLLIGGSDQGLLRRLQRLFQHGYLDRPRIQQVRGNAPMIYALGQNGAELLAEGGSRVVKDWSEKNRQVRLRYLEHALMVSRFQTALRHAESSGLVRVERWLPDGAITAAVRVERHDRTTRIPIRPDAFVVLRTLGDAAGRIHCCLEADRSTMPLDRFEAKLHGYWHWWRSGQAEELLGMRNFLVVTVTRSPERARHLLEACRAVSDRGLRMFLFADESTFLPAQSGAVLKSIWSTPSDRHRHSLLE